MTKFALVIHNIVDILEAQATDRQITLSGSLGRNWDIGGGIGGSLNGVTHLLGVSGTPSAPSTCGIPPGDDGVMLLVDSHTFCCLLACVSRAKGCCC